MQYYTPRSNEEGRRIIEDIQKLLKGSIGIKNMVLLGGEPFLYKDIAIVLDFIINCKKILNIEIVTNGTVWPNEKVLSVLKNSRARVVVSDYGDLSTHKADWANTSLGFSVEIRDKGDKWYSYGGVENRNRTENELKRQYIACNNYCYSFFKGKIYRCPRASHGMDLGYVPYNEKEVANIRDASSDKEVLFEISKFDDFSFSAACNYCDNGTSEYVPVRVAVQLKE